MAGLVFKAHRLVYHSTLGVRVIQKKKSQVVLDILLQNQQWGAQIYSDRAEIRCVATKIVDEIADGGDGVNRAWAWKLFGPWRSKPRRCLSPLKRHQIC